MPGTYKKQRRHIKKRSFQKEVWDPHFEELTIADDFIFSKVFQNPMLCRELLNRILPELKIRHIRSIVPQKTIKHYYRNKGIRLDIYAVDDAARRFDIEMQLSSKAELSKRTRYYASMMDADILKKGKEYDTLSEAYVIFICTFDPFDSGYYKYVFRNRCDQNASITLDDETYRIYLNTKGKSGEISPELKAFISYVENNELDENDRFLKRIDQVVRLGRQNATWRNEYMTYKNIKRTGFLEGREEGSNVRERTFVFRMLKNGRADATILEDAEITPERLMELKTEYEALNR